MSVHTLSNPFVPRASVVRFSNGVFEIRLHMQGVASDVQLVPHENYILVTGRVAPRAHIDANGTTSKVLWADYPCGYFGRDVQLKISPNTTIVVLERRQESDGLVIRYTLRPKAGMPYGVVYPQIDAFSVSGVHQSTANAAFASAAFANQRWTSHDGVSTLLNQPVYGPVSSSIPYAGPFVTNVPGAGVAGNVGFAVGAESNAQFAGNVGVHGGPVNIDAGLSAHVDAGVTLKEGVQPLL